MAEMTNLRTTTQRPADTFRVQMGLTTLWQWTQHVATSAAARMPLRKRDTIAPTPRTKSPKVGETSVGVDALAFPAQKVRPEATVIDDVPDLTQPETMPSRGFIIQAPGPNMPLLARRGKLLLCKLANR